MTNKELIAALQKLPPDLGVHTWDEKEDDYVPVVEVLYEDGVPYIHLLTTTLEDMGTTAAAFIPEHLVGHFPCEGCRVCQPIDPRDRKG